MSEMVRRVTAAIRDARPTYSLDEETMMPVPDYTPLAVAAIKAMRDPTDEMIRAAKHKMDMEDAYGGIANCYEAMIEEALK